MTQPQQQQQEPIPEDPVQKQQQEYKHPENEIALEPMDPKDVQQPEQKQEQTQGEQKQEQGQAKQEPKPTKPGSYHGEISPGGQWTWKGTGAPDDAWVAKQ